MATFTHIDPDKLKTGAANSAACLGELEGCLNGMWSAQDELAAAVKGATGHAAQKALSDAYNAGKSLGGTLQEIIDALNDAHVKIDAHDLDAAQQVTHSGNADGFVSAGGDHNFLGATGQAAYNSGASKVDFNTWH
ncbi:WXG100 family type VII secretion target [Nocardia nepalensis]|uniref:WXG100 family type VII secretion target n=1 Tax=Nocardia nepalensis TaxID=3375448 RepID=UPI003B67351A